MSEENKNPVNDAAKMQSVPMITMKIGNTTFVVGLHFSDTSSETLEDKVKRMIRKDVSNGNF